MLELYFCIRDDDTSFFTRPEELEQAYGSISCKAPISLAIVPFCRAGTSKGVPEKFRNQWTVHPLHENASLVSYLRQEIAQGRFEAMLHGYYHDERSGIPEFSGELDLQKRVLDGRKYLEDLLQTRISVFVPPHNSIGRLGLRAIEAAGLHLGGVAGVRSGWPLSSVRTWQTWARLKWWQYRGGVGVPWQLDMGGHREIPGNAITPFSRQSDNEAAFDAAISTCGVFCAATHYWELDAVSRIPKEPTVGEQLRLLVDRALQNPQVVCRSLGAIACEGCGLA
jgi:hypothetical protein